MTGRFSRRRFLAGAAAASWLVQLGTTRAWGGQPGDPAPFFFIAAADPQLFWGPRELWEKTIDHVNRLGPAFLVVCGDLIQEPGNDEQAEAYLDVARRLDESIRLHNVAGNHDVHPEPTPESIEWFHKRFGQPWYAFTHGGSLFVVLESDVLNRPQRAPQMAGEQMAWLRRILAGADEKDYAHVIVFKHFPLCLKAVDEKDQYFNVPTPRRTELLGLFHKHAVTAVFSGHYHRNAYVKDGDLELVTTSSCGKPLGDDPVGLRIVKVYGNRIEHRYYGFEELPERVEL
ncbi:MAG: metallophosphoesterase [Planctomycetota bacterium]|jgi:predicted phosphodiesterase